VTLGFGEIVRIAATNDILGLTNGAKGLPLPGQLVPSPLGLTWLSDNARFSIPALGFNFQVTQNLYWYFAVVLLCIFTIFIVRRLDNSRLGRAWVAMREDEVAASSVGVNVRTQKLWAFSLGAVWGGLAGVVFANFQGFVSPESFTFMESVFIVSMVVLGGMGSIPGVMVGALLITGIPELIRWAAASPMLSGVISPELAGNISNYRYLAFGLLMVIMMGTRPQGFIPSKRRALELHPEDERQLEEENQSLWDLEHGADRSEHDL
jgi:branched-chain amino acid transport system permease protein